MLITEAIEYHDTLNPKIWTSENTLRPEVERAIHKIVDFFISNLDIQIPVLDIYLLGSNASYNYSPTSDLDVHIITNYSAYDCDENILQAFYNALKTLFNKDYDFTIHGINVELYIQDVNSSTISNGVYSVYRQEWIKFPKHEENVKTEIDNQELFNLYKQNTMNALSSLDSKDLEKMIDDLYLLRQRGLMTGGEYSDENLIFKEIRSLGLLDELKDKRKELISKELTVESVRK